MKKTISIKPKKIFVASLISAAFVMSGCNSINTAPVDNPTNEKTAVNPENSNIYVDTTTQLDDNLTSIPSMVSDEQREEFLEAINAARADTQDCGEEGVFDPAPALTWNNMLDNAAYEHSNDMAQSDTFSHDGSGTASDVTAVEENLDRGSKFYERIKHNGYINYRAVGENIAAGFENAQEVVEAWLESDHHCANLMNPKYKEVGMALVEKVGTKYRFYWSQEFGGK